MPAKREEPIFTQSVPAESARGGIFPGPVGHTGIHRGRCAQAACWKQSSNGASPGSLWRKGHRLWSLSETGGHDASEAAFWLFTTVLQPSRGRRIHNQLVICHLALLIPRVPPGFDGTARLFDNHCIDYQIISFFLSARWLQNQSNTNGDTLRLFSPYSRRTTNTKSLIINSYQTPILPPSPRFGLWRNKICPI